MRVKAPGTPARLPQRLRPNEEVAEVVSFQPHLDNIEARAGRDANEFAAWGEGGLRPR